MTFERNPGPPAEPGPTPVTSGSSEVPTPVQIRLQILSTEHWSPLASRGLAWNEMFSRAGMYLSTLSGAMVALGLIGGVDGFGDAFFTFALIIMPVVQFMGFGTWIRMGAANFHDGLTVFGMNRIRGAYLEIAPELEPYFVMGVHDDPKGVGITMGIPPGTTTFVHIVASTPFLIVVLNSVVAGSIAALLLIRFLAVDGPAIVVGALVVALIVLLLQVVFASRRIRDGQAFLRPMFPTPGDPGRASRVFGASLPDLSPDRSPPPSDDGDRPGA